MVKLSEKERTLHEAFVGCGRNAKEWMRKCELMLPKIESERIWRKKGFFLYMNMRQN
ncbi:hypothetical protein GF354_05745 [Candidatus Peregrinibacteria bacterium]|nr:hypothetical protein [Candidatus Peregrinibacteria bacterium]